MNTDLALVLVLLIAAIVMFAINQPRMDVVALIMLAVLPFTGVLSMGEALAGFSDPNIVLIAALFVIGEGLVRTGVARRLGDWLSEKAGSSDTRLIVLLMIVVCGLGATMSSTAVTAIFIPVVLRIAQGVGTSPSRLMMPLSFAALISGMTTLIATAPNLVVNSELVRHGEKGFRFFSFAPFGVPILIAGIIYILFARRWLSNVSESDTSNARRQSRLADWIDDYKLASYEQRARVSAGSSLVGKALGELGLRRTLGANLIAVERNGKLIQPNSSTELRAGDVMFIDLRAPNANIPELHQKYALEALPLTGAYFSDLSQQIGMAEVILPVTSSLVGKTAFEIDIRTKHGLTLIGLRRNAGAIEGDLLNERFEVGDTLLVIGPWRAIRNAQADVNEMVVFNLPSEFQEVLPVADKAFHAAACLLLVVGLMVSGLIPNVQAALIGCLLMGALGCVDPTSAYRSIDWKTIVLIVGMLPFSIALKRTGGVDMAADGLMTLIGDAGPRAILATLFVITAMLGMFISNTATAVLMAPIAISVAEELSASPYPFAMIVALAASTAFMTPVSSPVNTLVVTPGNYTFGDFIRVGVPFSLIVLLVSVIMVPWLLPL